MRVSDFHFDLPEELIAQHPPARRGSSRMLVLDRATGAVRDDEFGNLPGLLRAGDLLVLNDSRVLPARLFATRAGVGTQAGSPAPSGVVEVLLVEEVEDPTSQNRDPSASSGQVMGHPGLWRALVRPAKKVRVGERLEFRGFDSAARIPPKQSLDGAPDLVAEVVGVGEFGERTLRFGAVEDFYGVVGRIGHMPLPPYIKRPGAKALAPIRGREESEEGKGSDGDSDSASQNDAIVEAEDRERYQTVFSQRVGSAAAPTAGLHFTPEVLAELEACGVEVVYVTLHVGLGTFQPVRVSELEDIRLHAERYTLPAATAEALNRALREGRRVVAVGTTTTRTLEHIAAEAAGRVGNGEHVPGAKARLDSARIMPGLKPRPISEAPSLAADKSLRFEAHSGATSIFIGPGHRFRVVTGLLTNFHLPESTLLMLVSAFVHPGEQVRRGRRFAGEGDEGRRAVLAAYAHAVREGYRFYSYGDCMLVV